MASSEEKKTDQRRLPRHALSEPVNVYDRATQSFMGRLVNIHAEGLMIMGNQAFEDENIYQLDLQLPRPINGHDMIAIGVDCLWSRSEEAHVHWAGCRVIDISDEALRDLEALIELFGQGTV
ncbi:MAG: PilZ domain-containing protein [Cellvibrionaceae bacterium]